MAHSELVQHFGTTIFFELNPNVSIFTKRSAKATIVRDAGRRERGQGQESVSCVIQKQCEFCCWGRWGLIVN